MESINLKEYNYFDQLEYYITSFQKSKMGFTEIKEILTETLGGYCNNFCTGYKSGDSGYKVELLMEIHSQYAELVEKLKLIDKERSDQIANC